MMAEEHAKRPDGFQERIIYVEGDVASCSGENNDHPLTYYRIPTNGYVVCGYCDIKFANSIKAFSKDVSFLDINNIFMYCFTHIFRYHDIYI